MSASSKKLLVGLGIVSLALAACTTTTPTTTDTQTSPADTGTTQTGAMKKDNAMIKADAKVDANTGMKADGAN